MAREQSSHALPKTRQAANSFYETANYLAGEDLLARRIFVEHFEFF
ncbi:MAG: hypothetical protein ACREJ2_10600 [Planctomycetota bacterium]